MAEGEKSRRKVPVVSPICTCSLLVLAMLPESTSAVFVNVAEFEI